MAVPLDAREGRVTGNPVPVHDPVPVIVANNGNSGIFVSPGGALVTSRGQIKSQLVWLAAGGGRIAILPDVRTYGQPTLSPDERRLAVLVTENQKTDVWVYDFTTRTFSRLTTNGTVSSVGWANGTHLIYAGRGDRERTAFWRQLASGGSAAEKLLEVTELAPSVALSPDSRSVVYQVYHNNTWDLFAARTDSTTATPRPYVSSGANETLPRFNGDGKWVAFLSDESGRSEVYVRSFPDPTSKVQISAEGAQEIIWSADGRKIYYRSGSSLLAASVELTPSFRVVRRDTVMTEAFPSVLSYGASYDVARDGRVVSLVSNRDNFQLVVSPNWITEFRAKIAASERTGRR